MNREKEHTVTTVKIDKKLHKKIVAHCKLVRAKVYVWVEDTLFKALNNKEDGI